MSSCSPWFKQRDKQLLLKIFSSTYVMSTHRLNVAQREKRATDLTTKRSAGEIPAVLYGHHVAPQMLWVKYLDFERLYREAGESSLVEIAPTGGKPVNVLVHDVQRDPVSNRFIHVDFYQVKMDEEIEADIPLEFVGEALAVKGLGGVLVRSLDELSVKCLPKDLPHSITVDISVLRTFDDAIAVGDLKLPAGVALNEAADTTIATVAPPRSEAEMASLDEKVDLDVTKVEGVVKETPAAEGEADTGKETGKKEEKKEGK